MPGTDAPTLREKILLHQMHPAKLATDIAAAAVSLYFFWQHEFWLGLITHFVPPPVASALVMRFADFQRYKSSRIGAYLNRYMTPVAQAARLAGDLVTVFAAWFHSLLGIAAGIVIVIAAWTHGAFRGNPEA